MSEAALKTLFHPFETGALEIAAGAKTLFLNAQNAPGLSQFSPHPLCQQSFKPYAAALQDAGYHVISAPAELEEDFDLVLVHTPKNKIEARYLLAQGVRVLSDGGVLIAAAANDAGGGRLKEFMEALGLKDLQNESKNKARVVWGAKSGMNETAQNWMEAGAVQEAPGGNFTTQPGIFGWNKIDRASEILTRHLPRSLPGKGADFGCGYGYLSRFVLERTKDVQGLICIDADIRSVKCAQENLKSCDTPVSYRWEDLTTPPTGLRQDLDFIIMNPPFHEGKAADIKIGTAFIKTASIALHPGGALYMVANKHLPYEEALKAHFTSFEKLYEGEGFKIFKAVR